MLLVEEIHGGRLGKTQSAQKPSLSQAEMSARLCIRDGKAIPEALLNLLCFQEEDCP
jgi:hypothetical protein